MLGLDLVQTVLRGILLKHYAGNRYTAVFLMPRPVAAY